MKADQVLGEINFHHEASKEASPQNAIPVAPAPARVRSQHGYAPWFIGHSAEIKHRASVGVGLLVTRNARDGDVPGAPQLQRFDQAGMNRRNAKPGVQFESQGIRPINSGLQQQSPLPQTYRQLDTAGRRVGLTQGLGECRAAAKHTCGQRFHLFCRAVHLTWTSRPLSSASFAAYLTTTRSPPAARNRPRAKPNGGATPGRSDCLPSSP